MKIRAIIFGSTGMIGQGVLLECLKNKEVEAVLLINRKSSGVKDPKVKEIILGDFSQIASLSSEFGLYNTCFYSMGVTAVGLTEEAYHKITYELTVHIAEAILKVQPDMTFCYISGAGTDSSEKGGAMWARVKGKLENKLLSMPFKAAYMFRPGYIQPLNGIKSRTGWYNIIYTVFKPVYFLLRPFKGLVTDTTSLAKAMISAALYGYEKPVIERSEINTLAERLR